MNKFPNFRSKKVEDFSYDGKIIYTADENEINYWCYQLLNDLENSKNIGFDMEWPMYKKTALIQIYSPNFGVFIFQIFSLTLPTLLVKVICNNSITKVGLNISNDIRKLSEDFNHDFNDTILNGLCDVGTLARKKFNNSERWSLANLILNLSGKQLPKPGNIRCGKWDQFPLTPDQIKYAALDAFASYWAYEKLNNE